MSSRPGTGDNFPSKVLRVVSVCWTRRERPASCSPWAVGQWSRTGQWTPQPGLETLLVLSLNSWHLGQIRAWPHERKPVLIRLLSRRGLKFPRMPFRFLMDDFEYQKSSLYSTSPGPLRPKGALLVPTMACIGTAHSPATTSTVSVCVCVLFLQPEWGSSFGVHIFRTYSCTSGHTCSLISHLFFQEEKSLLQP